MQAQVQGVLCESFEPVACAGDAGGGLVPGGGIPVALGVVGTAFGGAAVAVGDGARGWRAPGGAFGPPTDRLVGSDGGRGPAWRARPTPP